MTHFVHKTSFINKNQTILRDYDQMQISEFACSYKKLFHKMSYIITVFTRAHTVYFITSLYNSQKFL
jgi:hypothetical protein